MHIGGVSANTLREWAESLRTLYMDIGGCFLFYCFAYDFVLPLLMVLCFDRSCLPPFREGELLQAAALQFGAQLPGRLIGLLFYFFAFALVYLHGVSLTVCSFLRRGIIC